MGEKTIKCIYPTEYYRPGYSPKPNEFTAYGLEILKRSVLLVLYQAE